jgi:hypothetical protein
MAEQERLSDATIAAFAHESMEGTAVHDVARELQEARAAIRDAIALLDHEGYRGSADQLRVLLPEEEG